MLDPPFRLEWLALLVERMELRPALGLVARPVLGLIVGQLVAEWLVAIRPVGRVLASPSAASPSLRCNLQGTILP